MFARDTQSGKVTHYKMVGVFDDYQRVSQIPKWVRGPLTAHLLSNVERSREATTTKKNERKP